MRLRIAWIAVGQDRLAAGQREPLGEESAEWGKGIGHCQQVQGPSSILQFHPDGAFVVVESLLCAVLLSMPVEQ